MNTFKEIEKKYIEINKMGYIKGINNNKNSAGLTLEKLLGSTGGEFNIPDFYDIEVKAIRDYDDACFDLFNSTFDGKYINSIKWLSENYGYPDKDFKNIKVIKGDIFANKFCKIGIKYIYKLKISKKERKIYLEIYDINKNIINSELYWDFDILQEKLERKASKLAMFDVRKKRINGNIYYKYIRLNLYKLKKFNDFINAIDKGIIGVTIKTGVHKSGKYIGRFEDHGTSFRISKQNICEIYECIKKTI